MSILGAEIITTNPLQITVIGVLIAVVFLSSIIGVLTWMLRLPKETERTRTVIKAVRSVNKLTRILVPLLNKGEAADRIVALASEMARHRNGRVELLVVIEVPFMLPLDAHVEEDEKQAIELLDRAALIGTNRAIKVSKHILKARNIGVAIVREAEDQAVDLILIANTSLRIRGSVQQINPAVEYVMKNAPCEVLVLSEGHTTTTSNGEVAGNTERVVTAAGATQQVILK